GVVNERAEAVQKTCWNPELAPVVSGQFNRFMAAMGGRTFAYVDRDIKDRAPDYPHELALRAWLLLEMKAPDRVTRCRQRMIVLNEANRARGCFKEVGAKRFGEESTRVTDARRDRKSTRLNSSHVKISYA